MPSIVKVIQLWTSHKRARSLSLAWAFWTEWTSRHPTYRWNV